MSLVLIALGAIRELLGSGALFADMHLLFGEHAAQWKIVVLPTYPPMLTAILPPGAFICTGLMIAMHTGINNRLE